MNETFKPGDWVAHKVSHRVMRVEAVNGEDVYCRWTENVREAKRTMFAAELLVRAAPRIVSGTDPQSGVHQLTRVR